MLPTWSVVKSQTIMSHKNFFADSKLFLFFIHISDLNLGISDYAKVFPPKRLKMGFPMYNLLRNTNMTTELTYDRKISQKHSKFTKKKSQILGNWTVQRWRRNPRCEYSVLNVAQLENIWAFTSYGNMIGYTQRGWFWALQGHAYTRSSHDCMALNLSGNRPRSSYNPVLS